MASHPSIDIHAHPGRFFLRQHDRATPFERAYGAPFVDSAVSDMRAGKLSAVFFATVADRAVLTKGKKGITSERCFHEGEAFSDHCEQIDCLQDVCATHQMPLAASADDIEAAFQAEETACVISVEGGDFIEDQLDRVADAAQAGVRLVTAVHYRVNQIGDIQTEAPVHGGLTPLVSGYPN